MASYLVIYNDIKHNVFGHILKSHFVDVGFKKVLALAPSGRDIKNDFVATL